MKTIARRAFWISLALLLLGSGLMGYRYFIVLKPMRTFAAALQKIETEGDARKAFGDPANIVHRGDEDAYSRTFECWVPDISDQVLVYSHDIDDNGLPEIVFLYVDSDGRITRRLICGS